MPRILLLLIIVLAAGIVVVESTPVRAGSETPAPGSGDVDCNGNVNAVDAALLLQFDAGLSDSLPCSEAADAYADGLTDSLDAFAILIYNAGFALELPITPSPPPNTEPGTILALDPQTGSLIWSVQPGMAAFAKPVVTGALVLVAGGDDCRETHALIVALDRTTGLEQWRKRVNSGGGCDAGLIAFGDVVIYRDGLYLVAINAMDRSIRWRHQLAPTDNGDGHFTVSSIESNVLIVREGSVLRSLNALTGEELWDVDQRLYQSGFDVNSTTIFAGSKVTGPGIRCGVSALDPEDGTVLWTAPGVFEGCDGMTASDDVVASCVRSSTAPSQTDRFGNEIGNQVLTLDAETGDQLWRRNGPCTRTQADDRNVYVQLYNTDARTLTAVDPASGEERWHIDGPRAANVLVGGAYAFLFPGYPDHDLNALDSKTGSVLWTRSLPGTEHGYGISGSLEDGVLYVAATGNPVPHD